MIILLQILIYKKDLMEINIALLLATLFTATNQTPLLLPLFESSLFKGPRPRLRHCAPSDSVRWVTYSISSNDCPAVQTFQNPFQERNKPSSEEICLCFDATKKPSRCIKSTIGSDSETIFKNFPVCWKNQGPSQSRYTFSFPVIDRTANYGRSCHYFSPYIRLHPHVPYRWFFGRDAMLNSDKRCNYEMLSHDEKLKALAQKAARAQEYNRWHCKQKSLQKVFLKHGHKKGCK